MFGEVEKERKGDEEEEGMEEKGKIDISLEIQKYTAGLNTGLIIAFGWMLDVCDYIRFSFFLFAVSFFIFRSRID